VLSITISPPYASIVPLEIASPSPVPCVFVEKLGSKSFSEFSTDIPVPLSVNETSTKSLSRSA